MAATSLQGVVKSYDPISGDGTLLTDTTLTEYELARGALDGSVFRMLDTPGMKRTAKKRVDELGVSTLQNISQSVETLSGGQRQAVAVARAAAFGSKVVILDEPTAALGVRETGQVLRMVRDLRDQGLGVILISHNMPNVFEVADRIHIQRLGRSAGVITPDSHTPSEAVAIMTGATTLAETPGKQAQAEQQSES